MIDKKKITEEFKTLFPKATIENHIAKLEEELKEVIDANDNEEHIKELADVVLCCCAISGFYPLVGECLYQQVIDVANECNILDKLEKEIEAKWKINKSSKWVYLKNRKVYKRIKNAI